MSVERCQEETTSSRFVMWMQYLREEAIAIHRDDYRQAKICETLALIHGNKKVKLEDFFVKLGYEDDKPEKEISKEAWIAKSKRFWHVLTGFTKRKK